MRVNAKLVVEIEYDDDTDAESVSNALDVLMDNAKSTAGVLEEHGDVRVGGFFVLEEPPARDRTKDVDEEGVRLAYTRLIEDDCPKCGGGSYETELLPQCGADAIEVVRCTACGHYEPKHLPKE